jgi:hypothetical protein
MDNDVVVFAQVMTVILGSTAAATAIFLAARAVWLWGSRTRDKVGRAFDESRIERIENAVDAIAIEVERISEAQRYTVGLLSDRLPPRVERVGEIPTPTGNRRVNTPH